MRDKILSFVLVICLMCISVSVCAPAAYALNYQTATIDSFNSTSAQATEEVGFITKKYTDELYDAIYLGLVNCQNTINIESYNVVSDDVTWVFSSVYNNNPELFYLNNQFGYAAYSNGKVAYLVPQYKYTGTKLDDVRADYNSRLEVIANHFDALSNIEAVVAVNDYLATHYEYDLENDPENAIRDAYSMLLNKRAVCQGYSLLFSAIMSKLGVETTSVVSASMNHQWNLVKLNDKWYHIDVTWDDPTGVPNGYSYHEYMLHSDTAMSQRLGHYDWVRIDNSSETCTDTTYDDWTWTETNSQLTPHNNKWYYTRNTKNGIEIVEISKEGTKIVHTQSDVWNVWGNPNSFYSITLSTATWWKNWLLFHTQDKLYCYDTVLDRVYYLTDFDVTSGYVYYIHADDGLLEYVISEDHNDFTNASYLNIDISSVQYSSDIDGDGTTGSSDYLEMLLAELGYIDYSELNYSDVNCDGVFDSADLLALQQINLGLSKPDVVFNN